MISIVGIQSGSAAVGESVWSGLKGIITQPIADVKKKGAVGILTVWFMSIVCNSLGFLKRSCWSHY